MYIYWQSCTVTPLYSAWCNAYIGVLVNCVRDSRVLHFVVRHVEQAWVCMEQHVEVQLPREIIFIVGVRFGGYKGVVSIIVARIQVEPKGWLDKAIKRAC